MKTIEQKEMIKLSDCQPPIPTEFQKLLHEYLDTLYVENKEREHAKLDMFINSKNKYVVAAKGNYKDRETGEIKPCEIVNGKYVVPVDKQLIGRTKRQ